MKTAIVFLAHSLGGVHPFVVHVPANATPGNCWQHEPRHYNRKHVHSVFPDDPIHRKINRRASEVHNLAPCGRKNTSHDFHDYNTCPERTRRSRFRQAKLLRKHGQWSINEKGYSAIDIAFGCKCGILDHSSFTPTELNHIHQRGEIAATSRAPLPPWRLADCWKKAS